MKPRKLFRTAVLYAVSPDEIGVVSRVAKYLAKNNANIDALTTGPIFDESADGPVRLYASVFLISAMVNRIDEIIENCSTGLPGIAVAVRTVEPNGGAAPSVKVSCSRRCRLTVMSDIDRVGIVSEVTEELAKMGVSLLQSATCERPAAFSGTPYFEYEMVASIPDDLRLAALREKLEHFGNEHDMDIEVELDRLFTPDVSTVRDDTACESEKLILM